MERIIYVSESKIKEADVHAVVSHIVAKAAAWNVDHDLTGALIFTGTHFVQVLEGRQKDIDDVMLIIRNDHRHGAISVIDRSPITKRQFSRWAMAYHGPSQFVSRHVEQLIHTTPGREQKRATKWFTQLALELLKP